MRPMPRDTPARRVNWALEQGPGDWFFCDVEIPASAKMIDFVLGGDKDHFDNNKGKDYHTKLEVRLCFAKQTCLHDPESNQIKSPAWCSVLPVHSLSLPPLSPPRHHGHLTRSFNGNMVRNFPTHGQPSAAQGSLTSCLNFDFAILNLFEPSAPWSDGPEVEHWAHFLILYYPESNQITRLV
jgi:hypothetical protein